MMTRKSGSISICWISSALLTTELHPEDPLRTWLSRGLPPKKSSWVGFHICHFFLLGPSAWRWSIKTALLAVQNCFAQGVHHLIGVVLSPNRPLASPLRALNFLMGMGAITKFAIHGRNNFRDISKYACPLLHRGLGLFGNQAKHALVEGNEFDVLLLQQVLYLRRPWGGQLMLFFPKVNAKLRYRSGLMETLGNI